MDDHNINEQIIRLPFGETPFNVVLFYTALLECGDDLGQRLVNLFWADAAAGFSRGDLRHNEMQIRDEIDWTFSWKGRFDVPSP